MFLFDYRLTQKYTTNLYPRTAKITMVHECVKRFPSRWVVFIASIENVCSHSTRRRIKVYKIPIRIRSGIPIYARAVRIETYPSAQHNPSDNGCYTKSRARKRICRRFCVAWPLILQHHIRTVRQKLAVTRKLLNLRPAFATRQA